MKKLTLVVLIIIIGVFLAQYPKELKSLVPKIEFTELKQPLGLAIKDNYLFVADSANSRIQVLKIGSNGNLSPQLSFGKAGKGLGEFGGELNYFTFLIIKNYYLYISDTANNRIQTLELKY